MKKRQPLSKEVLEELRRKNHAETFLGVKKADQTVEKHVPSTERGRKKRAVEEVEENSSSSDQQNEDDSEEEAFASFIQNYKGSNEGSESDEEEEDEEEYEEDSSDYSHAENGLDEDEVTEWMKDFDARGYTDITLYEELKKKCDLTQEIIRKAYKKCIKTTNPPRKTDGSKPCLAALKTEKERIFWILEEIKDCCTNYAFGNPIIVESKHGIPKREVKMTDKERDIDEEDKDLNNRSRASMLCFIVDALDKQISEVTSTDPTMFNTRFIIESIESRTGLCFPDVFMVYCTNFSLTFVDTEDDEEEEDSEEEGESGEDEEEEEESEEEGEEWEWGEEEDKKLSKPYGKRIIKPTNEIVSEDKAMSKRAEKFIIDILRTRDKGGDLKIIGDEAYEGFRQLYNVYHGKYISSGLDDERKTNKHIDKTCLLVSKLFSIIHDAMKKMFEAPIIESTSSTSSSSVIDITTEGVGNESVTRKRFQYLIKTALGVSKGCSSNSINSVSHVSFAYYVRACLENVVKSLSLTEFIQRYNTFKMDLIISDERGGSQFNINDVVATESSVQMTD